MAAKDGSGHLVVTIARQMGAGGNEIGQRLAKELQSAYLDKRLLTEAARRLSCAAKDLEPIEEQHLPAPGKNGFWRGLSTAFLYGPSGDPTTESEETLFSIQRDIIRETAARGTAVIVGRAAHWVLKDNPLVLSIFLHAAPDVRARRLQRLLSLSDEEEARALADSTDEKRAAFSEWVSGLPWTLPFQYHLCLDTGRLGLELSHHLIIATSRRLTEAREGATDGRG